MPYIFILLFTSLFLLMFKAANLGIRLSDTNVYFYTAYQLLHDKILYKDIFFTNFPLFPYISTFYVWISGGSMEFYYLTSTLEVIATSVVLFYILKRQFKDELTALLGGILYLFSFILLATSDHQTGVFFLSLLGSLAYFFYISKRVFLTGICIGLALCTKAYFLPVAGAFFLFILLKDTKQIFKLVIGALITGIIIFLPTLLLASSAFIDSLNYSLTRSQGLDKFAILRFFILHDTLLFGAFIFSLTLYKKQLLLFLISLFSIIFVFLYRDMYYLYLNFLVPYLIIAAGFFYHEYIIKSPVFKNAAIGAVIFISLINCYWYLAHYSQNGKVSDFDGLVQTVKTVKPDFIYGEEPLATAIAYKSNVPMLSGIVDTNANIFRKGILNADSLTMKAVKSRTVIVASGAEYPQANIHRPIISEIMNKDLVLKKCKIIATSPAVFEDAQNEVTILTCF